MPHRKLGRHDISDFHEDNFTDFCKAKQASKQKCLIPVFFTRNYPPLKIRKQGMNFSPKTRKPEEILH